MNLGNTCFMNSILQVCTCIAIIYVMFKMQTENLSAILQFKATPFETLCRAAYNIIFYVVVNLTARSLREKFWIVCHTLYIMSLFSHKPAIMLCVIFYTICKDLIYLKDTWLFFPFFRASHSCRPLQHGYKIFLMKEMEIL